MVFFFHLWSSKTVEFSTNTSAFLFPTLWNGSFSSKPEKNEKSFSTNKNGKNAFVDAIYFNRLKMCRFNVTATKNIDETSDVRAALNAHFNWISISIKTIASLGCCYDVCLGYCLLSIFQMILHLLICFDTLTHIHRIMRWNEKTRGKSPSHFKDNQPK